MSYCIAVDSGGTKADIVLFDETGHIIKKFTGFAGNATDIGAETARQKMLDCLDRVFEYAPGCIDALYAGAAGVLPNGDIYSEAVKSRYRVRSIRFDDDGCSIISGGLGHRDGCGMVCGTGSSLFVRIEGEPLRHIGGKGYLIDTGGSGFELGRAALCMAMRAVDGRCEKTLLCELLAERLGQPVDDRMIPRIHRGGRAFIASLAPVVFEGRARGDRICSDIFESQSSLMADLTFAAERYFTDRFSIVMGGGLIAHFPEYAAAIRAKSSPRADMITQDAPPVFGAAVEAMWDSGAQLPEDFKARFLYDYNSMEPISI